MTAHQPLRLAPIRDSHAPLELVPSPLEEEELLEVYATRGLLEERAARLAAEQFSSDDVARIEEIASCIERGARGSDKQALLTLDRSLHFAIYEAAERPHLLRLIEQLWEVSHGQAPIEHRPEPDLSEEGLHILRSMVSACRAGDSNALGLLIRYKVRRDAGQVSDLLSSSPNSKKVRSIGKA